MVTFLVNTHMVTTPHITIENANRGHDPRAVSVAQAMRDLIDAECVILFGSRSRKDWTGGSDIDIMVITPELPTQADEIRITAAAEQLLDRTYDESPIIDLVVLSCEQYRKRSGSINNVAAIASREGIKLTLNPDELRWARVRRRRRTRRPHPARRRRQHALPKSEPHVGRVRGR